MFRFPWQIREERPDVPNPEVVSMLADGWSKLNDEDKAKWTKAADEVPILGRCARLRPSGPRPPKRCPYQAGAHGQG